jgi:hypothetical protein
MSRITIIALLICFGVSVSFAQDSVKKKAPVKPYSKYTYKRHSYHYYQAKAESVAKAPVEARPIKADTSAAARPPAPADKSLNGQYQYLLSKVYRYQQPLISGLWKNASDTLNANRAKLKAALVKSGAQTKTIDSLNNEISTLTDLNARKDGVSIFGLIMPKTTYNLIVWGVIIILAVIAVVVVGRSAVHRHEARYRTQLYSELEEEYKNFKVKANDKEKKLARELQTERNKLDDLLGRG